MAFIIHGFHNLVAGVRQEEEVSQLRRDMKAGCELGKVIGTAMAVVALALTVFSLMGGGFFGFVGLTLGLVLGVIAYDTIRACTDGARVADQPRFFPNNLEERDPKAVFAAVRTIMDEVYKNTLVLKPISAFILQMVENDAAQQQQRRRR